MNIQYQWTLDDATYDRFRLSCNPRLNRLVSLLVPLFLAVWYFFLTVGPDSGVIERVFLSIALGVLSAVVYLLFFRVYESLIRRKALRLAKRYSRTDERIEYEFSDQHIVFRMRRAEDAPTSGTLIQWKRVRLIDNTRDYIELVLADGARLLIPKRIFDDEDCASECLKSLRALKRKSKRRLTSAST